MKAWVFVSTVVGSILLAQVSSAATLNTAPLHANNGESFECTAVNVGTKPIGSVTVDIMGAGFTDNVLSTATCTSLPADVACYTLLSGGAYARCRITIVGGSATKVRGLADIRNASNVYAGEAEAR